MILRKNMIVIHCANVGPSTPDGGKIPVGVQTSSRPAYIGTAKSPGNRLDHRCHLGVGIVRDDHLKRLILLSPQTGEGPLEGDRTVPCDQGHAELYGRLHSQSAKISRALWLVRFSR